MYDPQGYTVNCSGSDDPGRGSAGSLRRYGSPDAL